MNKISFYQGHPRHFSSDQEFNNNSIAFDVIDGGIYLGTQQIDGKVIQDQAANVKSSTMTRGWYVVSINYGTKTIYVSRTEPTRTLTTSNGVSYYRVPEGTQGAAVTDILSDELTVDSVYHFCMNIAGSWYGNVILKYVGDNMFTFTSLPSDIATESKLTSENNGMVTKIEAGDRDIEVVSYISLDATNGSLIPNALIEPVGIELNLTKKFAFGYNSEARGKCSIAIGERCIAQGENSTAFGRASIANKGAFAAGYGNFAWGDYSCAIGGQNKATGTACISVGNLSKAEGDFSIAVGKYAYAYAPYSYAEGWGTTTGSGTALSSYNNDSTEGYFAHVEGNGSRARGNSSHAQNVKTLASGYASTAIGNSTTASNDQSFAGGINSSATGKNSFAFGYDVRTSNEQAVAFGYRTSASGADAVAIGRQTIARDVRTFAQGTSTIASGQNAMAGGTNSKSVGHSSFAFGHNCVAGDKDRVTSDTAAQIAPVSLSIGMATFACGSGTWAHGEASFAAGKGTVANGTAQFVCGKWNNPNDNALFIVGKGSSSSSKSNALVVHQSGNVYISGDIVTTEGGTIRKYALDSHTHSYVPTSRTVNEKALSSNISLSASDVGALPISGGTVEGSVTISGDKTFINFGKDESEYYSGLHWFNKIGTEIYLRPHGEKLQLTSGSQSFVDFYPDSKSLEVNGHIRLANYHFDTGAFSISPSSAYSKTITPTSGTNFLCSASSDYRPTMFLIIANTATSQYFSGIVYTNEIVYCGDEYYTQTFRCDTNNIQYAIGIVKDPTDDILKVVVRKHDNGGIVSVCYLNEQSDIKWVRVTALNGVFFD